MVYWSIDRQKDKPIAGYDIYLSEKPLAVQFSKWDKSHPAPYNHTPYPGDTDGDPTKESFEIKNLENGKNYYVSVRTVGIGGIESGISKELRFVTLSKGKFTISSNHSSDNGGFNFENGVSTPARDPRCDIYLYAKKDVVGISSPSRLSAGLRETGFAGRDDNYLETMTIKKGDRLKIRTTKGLARVTIDRINRKGTEAEAVIDYVFYPRGYTP